MAKKLTDSFSPPEKITYDGEDLLRCGWNRHGKRCKLPGSIRPQGEARHLCRWHANLVLFSDPRFANDEQSFNEWIEAKRRTWVPVSTADIWLKQNHAIFRMVQGL